MQVHIISRPDRGGCSTMWWWQQEHVDEEAPPSPVLRVDDEAPPSPMQVPPIHFEEKKEEPSTTWVVNDKRNYVHSYSAPLVAVSKVERDQKTLFKASEDMLDFEKAADAMSVMLHHMDFCGVAGVFGQRGSGRSAFLELLWQALQRRQAEAHAREIAKYTKGSCCCSYTRWRYCTPGIVDYGGSGTLHGYYILCKIECADLLSSDRVWGTILDALWAAIDKEYGAWALPYFAQVGAANYPRYGPVFLKFALWTLLKLAALGVVLYFIIMFLIKSETDEARSGLVRAAVVVASVYLTSVEVAAGTMVAFSAVGYLVVFMKSRTKQRRQRIESKAADDEKWRSEKGGFHHKVFQEVATIVAMLEVHIRHRRAWPLFLRLCVPSILDGILCDLFFTCYAWPEIVVSVDDIDKVPSPIAVRLVEALTAMSHVQGPVRHASPFKVLLATDPLILDQALGSYFAGASSAYDAREAQPQPPESRLAEGERFLRSLVTVHFELPPVTPGKRSALARKMLTSVGVRAPGEPDDLDRASSCCSRKKTTVRVVVPENAGSELHAEHGDRVLKLSTPRNAETGTLVRVPHKTKKTLPSLPVYRNCDPQFMPRKRWRQAAETRTSFGGELLPGDLLVFDALSPFLPSNPRRLWRVVSAFHIAQRLARWSPSSTVLDWRKRLLRFVLASERWPYRFAWLAYVLKRDDAVHVDAPLATVYATIDIASSPLLSLDDDSVQELLEVLGPLQARHFYDLDPLVRNGASALHRHIAQL